MRLALTAFLAAVVVVVLGLPQDSVVPANAYPGPYKVYLPAVFKLSDGSYVPPTPTATPTASLCNGVAQVLQNGGFESNLDYWSILDGSPSIYTLITNHLLHLGALNNTRDGVGQTVTVPGWAETGAAYFTYYMDSFEAPGNPAADYFTLTVLDSNGNVITSYPLSNATAQRLQPVSVRLLVPNIAAYRGTTVGVGIAAINDVLYPTNWYVDDVALQFACGNIVAGN